MRHKSNLDETLILVRLKILFYYIYLHGYYYFESQQILHILYI